MSQPDETTGRVVRNTGAHYVAETPAGEINCKVKGNFRIRGLRTTNPVAVGDIVSVAPPGPDGTAYITAIEPRRNYIIRRSINLSKQAHIIAANIDRAVLVATLAHPSVSTNFIDRFLATAEAYRVPALLCINKTDLLADEPDGLELLHAVEHLYRTVGYEVVSVSARTGQGMENLRKALAGKTSLLCGNSGVGKSTIVNDLIPGLEQRTAEISAVHDQGMHTTTFSELFHLPGDLRGASSTPPAYAASALSTSNAPTWATTFLRFSNSPTTAGSTTAPTCTSQDAPCSPPSTKAAWPGRATLPTSASLRTPMKENTENHSER